MFTCRVLGSTRWSCFELTKRFGGRPKDLEDIRLLEALRKEQP
ncbi:MAG: hypothetical protein ACHQNV_08095 [Vicinamibacteria bacterium]